MSRLAELKFLTRWWGVYFLYFVVMGSLGVASAHLGSTLSKTVAANGLDGDVETPRALSRVERHASLKVPPQLDAVHSPARPVAAMIRPDIHPAALAASMDRAEEADAQAALASTASEPATRMIRVAACALPACDATRVKGWKKSIAAKRHGTAGRVVVLVKTTGSKVFVAKTPGSKSSVTKIAAADAAGVRAAAQKAGSKDVASNGKRPLVRAVVLTSKAGHVPAGGPIRLADTPGDIVRRSLSGAS